MGEGDEAVKRLMRLLAAGFRYHETVDESVWLHHPHRENGRVIFYQDGLVVSVEHREFAQVEPEDREGFERFLRFLKPASKRDRLAYWADDILTWGCLLIFVVVILIVSLAVEHFVKAWWHG